MISIIFFTIVALALIVASFSSALAQRSRFIRIGALGLAVGLFFLGLGIGSSVAIGDREVGIVTRHIGNDLPPGQIVARDADTKGPQARILGPGIHFKIWPVFLTVEAQPLVTIPSGQVGLVYAKDGRPLPDGQTFAPAWPNVLDMIDAEKFLDPKSGGFRGPQVTVLPPGDYRINLAQFRVDTTPALVVPAGSVAVIKSNTGKTVTAEDVKSLHLETVNGVPLVPEGYKGIWLRAFLPGTYYINPNAFTAIFVKTTQRTFTYQASDLQYDERSGQPNASNRPSALAGTSASSAATDESITVRTKDGFTFPIDVRIAADVDAADAPYNVALLGDPDHEVLDKQEDATLEVIEARIILPTTRAILRNVGENMSALEFINGRSTVEKTANEQIIAEIRKYRINGDGVYIGNIHLAATEAGRALIKTQTDKEVAVNQALLFQQQQKTEGDRKNLVESTTRATRQKDITDALIDIEVKKNAADARAKEAKGQSDYDRITGEGRAAAYKAQVEVFGPAEVGQIELMRIAADKSIQITPQVMVGSSGPNGAFDALAGTILRQQVQASPPVGK